MSDELIINVCPTGMIPRRADTPHVPITPEEVAADVRRCADLGASIVHVHPRDESGRPTQDVRRAAEFLEAIRQEAPDIVLCATTSGRVVPDLEPRAAVLDVGGDAGPEMASLTLGSLNFPRQASVNEPETIKGLAQRMADRHIVPEWEIFDLGMIDFAHYLRDHGLLMGPVYANVLLGSLGTLSATPFNLALAVERLPAGAVWAGAGIGRFQFAVNKWAIAMGGHVRVGLEDNIWFDDERTQLASNPRLVERVVAIARASGREPAKPASVRERLGITREVSAPPPEPLPTR
jgi:3-keto-5-aminohexanoate cleavage enzyme